MYCKSTKNIKIIQDEGDFFEDEFDDYHSEMQTATMKPQNWNLDHAENLDFDPFFPSFILKNTIFSDIDQESFCDPDQVRTPKHSTLAFEINYSRPLPVSNLTDSVDKEDDCHEKDGANNHSDFEIQKIFNNAPSRIISIIREEADEIRFMEEELSNVEKIKIVREIFYQLIQEVLRKLKGEDKRKTLMIMLLNKVDRSTT